MSSMAQETASARPSGHNHDDTCSASSHPSQVKDDDTCIASSQPSPAKDERTADAADERSQATTQIRQQDDRFCLELTSLPFYAEWLSNMSMDPAASSSKMQRKLVVSEPSFMKRVQDTMHVISGTSDCNAGKFFAQVHEDVRNVRSIWHSTAPIARSSPFKVDYRRHSK